MVILHFPAIATLFPLFLCVSKVLIRHVIRRNIHLCWLVGAGGTAGIDELEDVSALQSYVHVAGGSGVSAGSEFEWSDGLLSGHIETRRVGLVVDAYSWLRCAVGRGLSADRDGE